MEIVVTPPDEIVVSAISPDVYSVTVSPAPAVTVTATTTGAQGPAGPGVPTDGATSTILTKKSATNFDTEWRDYLDNIKSVTLNTAAGESTAVGKAFWDDTNGTFAIGLKGGNVTLQVGQELVQLVKHADNSGLADGKVVYVVGSTGDNLTVRYAKADSGVTADTTIGVMTESATGGNKAFMTTYGLVHDIDTSGLTEGAIVWLSPTVAGGMTTTQPTAPNHAVMIGVCVRTHAVNGHLFVMPNNGYELEDLHNVLITSPANNDVLTYETSSGLWKNKPVSGGSGAVSSVNGQTGNVVLTKSDLSLGNVDNTSDANKPISTATQTALNAKQDALGFTPVPDTRTVAGKALSADVSLVKADVGLGNVDNTSDANKPVSTAQATAIGLKQDTLVSGTNIKTVNGASVLGSGDIATVTGSGTTGKVPKFSGASALADSVITEDTGRIGVGTSLFLDSGNYLRTVGTVNGVVQTDVTNLSNGTSASSDMIATADTGNNTTNYVDVGINSSTYSDPAFTIGGALAGYLYSNGGDLTVGTQTAAKVIKFHTGGTLAANLRMTIADAGTQSINLVMQPQAQVNSQVIPTGYTAITNTRYAITGSQSLTIQGNGIFVVR